MIIYETGRIDLIQNAWRRGAHEEITRKVGGKIRMGFICHTMEFGFQPIDRAEPLEDFKRWVGPNFHFKKITLAVA